MTQKVTEIEPKGAKKKPAPKKPIKAFNTPRMVNVAPISASDIPESGKPILNYGSAKTDKDTGITTFGASPLKGKQPKRLRERKNRNKNTRFRKGSKQ